MTDEIGTCPDCGTIIPEANVLIEYEHGRFAECPGCEKSVKPQESC